MNKICRHRCHWDGAKRKLIRACCSLTYKKYISKDGVIDLKRYAELIKEKEAKSQHQ